MIVNDRDLSQCDGNKTSCISKYSMPQCSLIAVLRLRKGWPCLENLGGNMGKNSPTRLICCHEHFTVICDTFHR